jgi:hypothetical protein
MNQNVNVTKPIQRRRGSARHRLCIGQIRGMNFDPGFELRGELSASALQRGNIAADQHQFRAGCGKHLRDASADSSSPASDERGPSSQVE